MIGDADRIRQIVVNLIGNAIKFTEHGEVVLAVHREEQDGRRIKCHFFVSDTGIGIPTNQLDKIFDAFEQADASMTRKFGGTGLGLAISSNLVRMMGGRMWAESEVGEGTALHFTACMTEVEEPGEGEEHSMLSRLQGIPALVVDDNATNRRILCEMLENWQLNGVSVPNLSEAMARFDKACDQASFRLMVIDSEIPGEGGFTFTKDSLPSQLAVPTIVMLTSNNWAEGVAKCKQAGLHYLMKPIKQSELFNTILYALKITGGEEVDVSSAARPIWLRPLKILLAEDSPVNQKLAVGLLTKYGHQLTVVDDGRKAVTAFRQESFDLILMDVQMPELDGLDATRAIRQFENRRAGGDHVPIVAMTAHAMKGDRELCLDAGMDDYVSKPIDAVRLFEVIAKAVGQECDSTVPESAKSANSDQTNDLVDWDLARKTVQDDEQLLAEILQAFLDELPDLMVRIRAAIESQDEEALRRGAHTLKSSFSHFGIAEGQQRSQELESLGRNAEFGLAKSRFVELDDFTTRVTPVLLDYLGRLSKC